VSGNFQSYWAAEGSYDFVAEALFNELDVDGFFSSTTTIAREVSNHSALCRGQDDRSRLITTKNGTLESKDDIKRRIDEASQFVSLDQLCLSTQCGFSSTVEATAHLR